jgi:hypothetical protein
MVTSVLPLSVVAQRERLLDSLVLHRMLDGRVCLQVSVSKKLSSGQSNTMPTRIA